MNRSLRKLLTGNHFTQEYLCLPLTPPEGDMRKLHFSYIVKTASGPVDITQKHLLLGYKPTVIGIDATLLDRHASSDEGLELSLQFRQTGEVVARLSLERTAGIQGFPHLDLFVAGKVSHRFITPLQQYSQYQLLDKIRRSGDGIRLSRSEHTAVRIAYALPRKISLVTLADGNRLNLFPTDLHGRMANHYIDSFRFDGLAAAQVLHLGRMVISHVSPGAADLAYSLGRNHMQPMKSAHHFPFEERKSKTWGWPLPRYTEGYDELELISFVDAGIHRIFHFRILHAEPVGNTPTLAHMHAIPASWLHRHNVPSNYLLRTDSPVKSGSS